MTAVASSELGGASIGSLWLVHGKLDPPAAMPTGKEMLPTDWSNVDVLVSKL